MLCLITSFILLASSCFGISISSAPVSVISAKDPASKLDRPEGIAFTPSGNFIAVANSLADTVTFYRRIGEGGHMYDTTPSFSIEGPDSQLNYPHDLSFSPNGQHLAVANRQSHAITIYKKSNSHDGFDTTPIAIITGEQSRIFAPDAVKFSPVENTFVVASMFTQNNLVFFYYEGDHFDQQPFQVITCPLLAIPDGLGFSSDGKLLAVTSHDNHCVVLFQRMENSNGRFFDQPFQAIQGEETLLCFPHSLAFHPFTNDLAVSCSQGRKNVNFFKRESEHSNATYFSSPMLSLEITEMYTSETIEWLDKLYQEGGVKGVAFSPDGQSLAIAQNLCQDELKLPYPVGIIAIYSLTMDESNSNEH